MPKLDRLALDGGEPVRRMLLPYARQTIEDEDISAVVEVLRSDWLTTGPLVEEFERAFASEVGAQHAIAVNSGTAALHAAIYALAIGPGDEVIVPALTFAATANCVVFQGAVPIFADVDPETLLVDPETVAGLVSSRTRAVMTVDYAGQACDYRSLAESLSEPGVPVVADACHGLGGLYRGRPVGSLARLNTFSFHPAKHITTAEGGMVTTDDGDLARRMRMFRNHGISTDHRERAQQRESMYEMVDLGFNYRLTDLQCALGLSQLGRLAKAINRRREIAARYDAAFGDIPGIRPLDVRSEVEHSYHLYVVRLVGTKLTSCRDEIFAALRAEGIGVVVHYPPVHLHPFYRQRFNIEPGLCPHAELAAREILTLPIFPGMRNNDVEDVIEAVTKVVRHFESV
jgi:perosamine synthetase